MEPVIRRDFPAGSLCVVGCLDAVDRMHWPKPVQHALRQAAPGRSPLAALYALADALRDNTLLPVWAVDELLDMQPTNECAKRLLCALAVHDLMATDECEVAMIDRDLRDV